MPRASVLVAAVLVAPSSVDAAPDRTKDAVLLQARATTLSRSSPHEGHVDVRQRMLGCFPRAAHDTDDEEVFQDLTCVSSASRSSSLEPCRSGMPFFRLTLQPEQSYLDCFSFCLSKGLDLAGLVHSERAGRSECRCGATEANRAAWHGGAAPPGLLLPSGSAVPQGSEHCKMLVWQYTGPLEYDALPTVLTELSVGDEAYIDGVAVGVDPHQIAEEDEPGEEFPALDPGTQGNPSLLSAKYAVE